MTQRISFLTIGVRDLDLMKKFYTEKFGWTPIKDSDGIVFFKMNGFILALFPQSELVEDIGITDEGYGFKRISLAVNFDSEKAVDDVFEKFRNSGVKIVKPPEKVFWGGYRGYISDAEENYWEIAYNPYLVMDSEGNVVKHK